MYAELRETGRINLHGFYVRRVARLYPVILTYAAVRVVVHVFAGVRLAWGDLLSSLFYYANYYFSNPGRTVAVPLPFDAFWSLSVEEHFYLLFPALFLALKGDPRRIAAAMLCVVFACLAARLAAATVRPDLLSTYVLYVQTQFRLDSIAWGVLLAALCEAPRTQVLVARLTGAPGLIAGGAMALLGLAISNPLVDGGERLSLFASPFAAETVQYSLEGAGIMLALAGLLFSERPGWVTRILNTPVLDWMGRLSYSLYVWNLLALAAVAWAAPNLGVMARAAVRLLLTFGLAAISYYAVEQPVVRLRRRLGSRTANAEPTPAAG